MKYGSSLANKGKKNLKKYEPDRGVTLKINYVNDTSLPPFK